jgi:hypothetical protein
MGGTGGGMGGGIATEVEEAGTGVRDPRRDLPFTGATPAGSPPLALGARCGGCTPGGSRRWRLRWAGPTLGAWVLDAELAGAEEP